MDDAGPPFSPSGATSRDPDSGRLRLTPIMWIAMALLGLIGVHDAMLRSRSPAVLNCLRDGHRIPIRRTDAVQDLERLGVRVDMPDGWTLLATLPNDRMTRPTFVNEAEGCVVKLFGIEGVDPIQRLMPIGHSAGFDKTERGAAVAWIAVRKTMRIEVDDHRVGKLPLSWEMLSPRRIGRWSDGDVKIGLLVTTNKNEAELPPTVHDFGAGLSRLPAPAEHDFPLSGTLQGRTND